MSDCSVYVCWVRVELWTSVHCVIMLYHSCTIPLIAAAQGPREACATSKVNNPPTTMCATRRAERTVAGTRKASIINMEQMPTTEPLPPTEPNYDAILARMWQEEGESPLPPRMELMSSALCDGRGGGHLTPATPEASLPARCGHIR